MMYFSKSVLQLLGTHLFYVAIDHVRLHDLPAQLNALLLSEAIGGFIWSLPVLEIGESTIPTDVVP